MDIDEPSREQKIVEIMISGNYFSSGNNPASEMSQWNDQMVSDMWAFYTECWDCNIKCKLQAIPHGDIGKKKWEKLIKKI